MELVYTTDLNSFMTVKQARERFKADRYILIGTFVQDITNDYLTFNNCGVCNVWVHDGCNHEDTVAIIEV